MGLDFVGVDPGAAVTFRDGGGGPGRAGLHCGAGQVRGGQVRDGKRGGQR